MTNSTISGNDAAGTTGSGGAIQTFAADVRLNNVTIANNSAGSIGGGINADINDQRFVISNAIVAGNHAPADPDCASFSSGPITSHDYNFIGDPSGCTLSGKTAHNLNGDPMLGPLQNNGGATDTQALLPGSPALGACSPRTPNGKGGHCAAKDQIGTRRSKGDCDIGAFQLRDGTAQ